MKAPTPVDSVTVFDDPADTAQQTGPPRGDREFRTAKLLEQAQAAGGCDSGGELRTAAVQMNLGLAHRIAGRYTGRGVERDDLDQVAALALVLATDRFDPRQEKPFTPYAVVTIHGELKRHLRDHAWAVRPPRGLHDTYLQVMRATEDLGQTLARTPTAQDIAEAMGIAVQEVLSARRVGLSYTAASVDALQEQYGDLPLAPGQADDRDGVDGLLTRLMLQQSVQLLSARDQLLLQLRFDEELTQQQIGAHLGISQMQVSRRLAAVITRLRRSLLHDEHGQQVLSYRPPTAESTTHPPAEQIAS